MPSGRSRHVGSSHRCLKTKRLLKKQFNARHIDQVFEDFSKPAEAVHTGSRGPVGTSSLCVSYTARANVFREQLFAKEYSCLEVAGLFSAVIENLSTVHDQMVEPL